MFNNNSSTLHSLWYKSHKQLITNVCIYLKQTEKIEELVEKYLGGQIKLKIVKDPKRPKKPKSSWMYFCNEKRDQIMADLKKNKVESKHILSAMSKKLGQMWGKISKDEKEKYCEMNRKDIVRYEEGMREYNELS